MGYEQSKIMLNRKKTAAYVLLSITTVNLLQSNQVFTVDLNTFQVVTSTEIHQGVGNITDFALNDDDQFIYFPLSDSENRRMFVYDTRNNTISDFTSEHLNEVGDLVFTNVEITNNPPNAFSLVAPADGDTVRESSVQFSWEYTTDPDGHNPVKYTLCYSTEENFTNSTVIQDIDLPYCKVQFESLDDSHYWWKVVAEDSKGTRTECMQVFSFTVYIDIKPPYFTAELPPLSFNEDDSLYLPFIYWYNFVDDEKCPDSLLSFNFDSGENVFVKFKNDTCNFTSKHNWFGTDTVQIIVADKSNLSSTAKFGVVVNPINDPPIIGNLPDSIFFRNDEDFVLDVSEKVIDVDSPDSLLNYDFSCSSDSLTCSVDSTNFGIMVLTALSGFRGRAALFISVFDDSSDSAFAAIPVRVDYPVSARHFSEQVPSHYELYQNFPNPFNLRTSIRFSLPKPATVIISSYNLSGELVNTIFRGNKNAGNYIVVWDAWQNSSGTYLIRMKAGDFTKTRKCVLLK